MWAQDSFEMNAIIPSFLKKGDLVSIVATARWIDPHDLLFATSLLEKWGFRVKLGKHLHTVSFQLAGTLEQRTSDMQVALDDPESKAILIARGGYGTVHLIDQLDFSRFYSSPKWICGYSDITVLHAHLNSKGYATIHSTMPVSFANATDAALENLRLALLGDLKEVSFKSSIPLLHLYGSLPLVGGNLSVLYSLLGSESLANKGDLALFMEDVDEMHYHIDRMMMGLKRASFFKNVKYVILGGLTQMRDNTVEFGFPKDNPWGLNANEIIVNYCKELGIAVVDGFPAGHLNDNRAFYLGMNSQLRKGNDELILTFQH